MPSASGSDAATGGSDAASPSASVWRRDDFPTETLRPRGWVVERPSRWSADGNGASGE